MPLFDFLDNIYPIARLRDRINARRSVSNGLSLPDKVSLADFANVDETGAEMVSGAISNISRIPERPITGLSSFNMTPGEVAITTSDEIAKGRSSWADKEGWSQAWDLTGEDKPSISWLSTGNDMGWRGNNPGNLRPTKNFTPTATATVYEHPTKGKFMQFSSMEEGWNALLRDLKAKQSGGSSHLTPENTVADLFNVYAPKKDNNDPEAYANKVTGWTGIAGDMQLKNLSDEDLVNIAKGIVRVESPNSYAALFKKGDFTGTSTDYLLTLNKKGSVNKTI